MPSVDKRSLLDRVSATGRIEPADVRALRGLHYADGLVDPAEADFVFDLEQRVREVVPDWSDFFVEAMTDHVVMQTEPHGYVGGETAQWLIGRLNEDGRIRSETELELLVRIVETARAVPFRLSAMALEEVRRAVVDGSGLTRHGALAPGHITMAEVALVRRVLYGAGGEGGVAVSREEAEALFDIDDAVGHADNAETWATLFAKAVGNYLMAAVLHETPSREDALRRQAWLDAPDDGTSFLDRFVDGLTGIGNLIEGLTQSLGDKVEQAHRETNARRARAIEEAERLSDGEVDWLVARMGRNGRLSRAEMALVEFLRSGHGRLPVPVEAVVARLERAA